MTLESIPSAGVGCPRTTDDCGVDPICWGLGLRKTDDFGVDPICWGRCPRKTDDFGVDPICWGRCSRTIQMTLESIPSAGVVALRKLMRSQPSGQEPASGRAKSQPPRIQPSSEPGRNQEAAKAARQDTVKRPARTPPSTQSGTSQESAKRASQEPAKQPARKQPGANQVPASKDHVPGMAGASLVCSPAFL